MTINTFKVQEAKSLAKIAVTVSAAVTSALNTKSEISALKLDNTKSPSSAPSTLNSFASSSPSAIEPASQVIEPERISLNFSRLSPSLF